ncbi:ABC transporter ATP-binding protein [Halorhabdus tiamatea SARL4B]|uniref:ABC transporter ATP-binding protein n=1 Tax=Halorhabdus tiamatea SARL4B TaxID=1033806 RepID=F7PFX5_9EURY|nr:ABC transporter ATP-binding protein [Halorhabdus tiamatea]ERJ07305.1 ABC transporter ATP-binding protein [Halorhabdus tiamatea SARL4B]CCQ34215.1 ABC transporter, ATP-binding protein [Halorhabdus tiamatea SARL4B]
MHANTTTTTEPRDAQTDDTGTALEVTALEKSIDGSRILDGVGLSVREGETYGVVGPNGAGKTTTFRCLLGLLPVDGGSVSLFGTDPRMDDTVLERVGVVFEYETLQPTWSVRDAMAHACHGYGVPTDRIETCLAEVDLEPAAHDREFRDLSKGMKRKASVATALLHEPDLLVLDEPLSGLDPGTQARMRELIDDLRESGRTVVFSSHDLDHVQALCDCVAVIADGRTVVETPLSESVRVIEEPRPEIEAEQAGEVYVVSDDDPPADARTIDLEELYFSALGVET